jgi:hypothetical protein
VTVIMGVIVGLTFLFGFGNVLSLGLRLGVSGWVAPLVAPAVDLSVLALLLATRHLALHGASAIELRPARRLLMFSSLVTLALNVADPLIAGEWGKAAFDAVGPFLLIGWAHVGPELLHALSRPTPGTLAPTKAELDACDETETTADGDLTGPHEHDLLKRATALDAKHWAAHRRPIAAETLRRELKVGAHRARSLVTHSGSLTCSRAPRRQVLSVLTRARCLRARPRFVYYKHHGDAILCRIVRQSDPAFGTHRGEQVRPPRVSDEQRSRRASPSSRPARDAESYGQRRGRPPQGLVSGVAVGC